MERQVASQKIKVGILGASGYTGVDLMRLLITHPNVELVLLSAERKAGLPVGEVFPNLIPYTLPDFVSADSVDWENADLDILFCALPHATSQRIILEVKAVANAPKIIDLSADFRLRDPETYAQWYGGEHVAKELQESAVYGLSEVYRDDIKGAELVACPGCYPTAALLALIPLLKGGLIESDDIIIDAKSGVSGAGRSLKETNLFTEVSEAMHPYGIGHHRHMPEIEQELTVAANTPVEVSFTPHLVPMNRGELETIYVKLKGGVDDVRKALNGIYGDEPFIHVLEPGVAPATRMVRGSNHCVLNIFEDRREGRAIIVAAIDNLVKGSSGQAIQNMNIMMGYPETRGLEQVALFP